VNAKNLVIVRGMVLECRDVQRSFTTAGQTVEVLKGVWLSLKASEVVAILGPSGSGKSTLLHLLAGLDKPTKGEVYWQAKPIHNVHQNQLAALRLTQLGLVFQHHYLLDELSVFENISLAGHLINRIDSDRAHHLIEAVGLDQRKAFLPKHLSGGEKQRVAVARALYNQPLLVLADEPTGSLDRENSRIIYQLLVDLARREGSAVVMVTHDEGLVKDVDKRYYLDEGVLKPYEHSNR
jgi:lipoprotein-releasing system ATP-binding protein